MLGQYYWKTINMAPQRYNDILKLIEKHNPKTICEIGTWNGLRAIEMAKEALKYSDTLHYYGFDLFETASKETDEAELNIKRHNTIESVTQLLSNFARRNSGFTFELFIGNTNDVLPDMIVDLVFIDGGHSVNTIQNDYNHLKNSKVIIFDDYYLDENIVDTLKWGCNTIVDQLDNVTIMSTVDNFQATGRVCIAAVENKS